eukprot:2946025-Pleurochrysis_carterae.AAC.1
MPGSFTRLSPAKPSSFSTATSTAVNPEAGSAFTHASTSAVPGFTRNSCPSDSFCPSGTKAFSSWTVSLGGTESLSSGSATRDPYSANSRVE